MLHRAHGGPEPGAARGPEVPPGVDAIREDRGQRSTPDAQVQQSLRMRDTSPAPAPAPPGHFRGEGLHFPRRPRSAREGPVDWQPPRARPAGAAQSAHRLRVRAAAAASAGRRRRCRSASGRSCCATRRLTSRWDRFEVNGVWRPTAQDRRRGPFPREGPAAAAGSCVVRRVRSGQRPITSAAAARPGLRQNREPRDTPDCGRPRASPSAGAGIDLAIGALLAEPMTPVTLTVALKVTGRTGGARQNDAGAPRPSRGHARRRNWRDGVPRAHPDNSARGRVLEAERTPGCALRRRPPGTRAARRAEDARTTRRRPAPTHPVPGHRFPRRVERSGDRGAPQAHGEALIDDVTLRGAAEIAGLGVRLSRRGERGS